MAWKIRRGTESDRSGMSANDPAQGELLYITDTGKLFVGDGVVAGGIGVGAVTYTKIIYIKAPEVTDAFPVFGLGPACTVTRITHSTEAGTVDWNIEERAEATPFTVGTAIYASDEQSSTSHSVDTSFSNDSIAANAIFFFEVSAIASTPADLLIKVTFTED